MKTILITLGIVFISIYFTSCTNKNDDDEYVKVLFEGKGLTKTSTASTKKILVYNSPIKIEEVKKTNNLVRNEIEKLIQIKGINIDNLDFNQIRLYTYLDTKTKALIIPKINKLDQDEIIIYLGGRKNVYANATLENTENGERLFKLSSLDNKNVFYSVIIGSNDKIKSLKVRKVIIPNSARNTTSNNLMLIQKGNSKKCTDSGNFNDCMVCAISEECAEDWVCAATCMVAPIPCLIGFGIACSFV